MQTSIHGVTVASEVIQLAIAPVFLLMGVSALLGVLTGRLGRVVDRFRVLNESLAAVQADDPRQERYSQELDILSCRANWVHWSITLCTFTLLLVAVVIGLLFLGSAINWDTSWLVSILFIFAMGSLISGLTCFIREISLSKHVFQLSKRKIVP
jgi:hypothetical protein